MRGGAPCAVCGGVSYEVGICDAGKLRENTSGLETRALVRPAG